MASQRDTKKTAFRAKIKIGSVDIPFVDIMDVSIVSELNLPDAFTLTLGAAESVRKDILPKLKLQDKIDAKLWYEGDKEDVAFIGELVRIEPLASNRGASGGQTVLRGYNAMQGLARGKRSTTYLNMTDKEIVEQVLKRNGPLKLTGDFGKEPPTIKYEHVYQNNKTDMQFILDRAQRTGYFVLVRDDKLLYQKRQSTPSGLKLKTAAARDQGDDKKVISLESFVPRQSTAHQVTEVHCRTWNPRTRKELIGKAPKSQGGGAQLGSETGKSAIEERYPDSIMVHWKTAFDCQEDGDAIAAAILDERMLSYVTADGTVPGDARIKPGLVVEVKNDNPTYDGKYFVTRVLHRYRYGDAHRFESDFHAKRDAVDKASGGQGSS